MQFKISGKETSIVSLSFLANSPKPEGQEENAQKRAPQAGKQERKSGSDTAAGKRLLFQ